MRLERIEASGLCIPFRIPFRHPSAERAVTETVWVEARTRGGAVGHGEGCPRGHLTGETVSSARAFVAVHRQDWLRTIRDLRTLSHWAERHRVGIDANPAAWAAVEIALLDAIGQEENRSVEALLGVPELAGRFQYTAVIGDAPQDSFEEQLALYRMAGFRRFKVKLSGDRERDLGKVEALTAAGIAPAEVRADANNFWQDARAAIAHLEGLGFAFSAVEEPLRSGDIGGMHRVAAALGMKIVLDESLARWEQLNVLPAGAWIVNLRVSTMGGIQRSLALARMVSRRGLGLIVGAHVGETSLLTRAALTVASGARQALLGQEGAFGTRLLVRDVVLHPIMFARAGLLDASRLGIAGQPGLGLSICADLL